MGPMNFRSGLLLYEEHLYSWLVIFWLSNHMYNTFDQKKNKLTLWESTCTPTFFVVICYKKINNIDVHAAWKRVEHRLIVCCSVNNNSFDQVHPLTLRAAVLALRFSCFCCKTVTSRICFSSSFTLCFQPSLDACSSSTFCWSSATMPSFWVFRWLRTLVFTILSNACKNDQSCKVKIYTS